MAATGNNIAEPYQPTSSKLRKSLVIEGMAVLITVYSLVRKGVVRMSSEEDVPHPAMPMRVDLATYSVDDRSQKTHQEHTEN